MAVTRSTAAELTTEQVARILVQPLQEASQFLAAGPRIFDTTGPFRLPKMGTTFTDPGWTGESELITEADIDFDEVQLLPSTMKSLKVITRYSNEMARASVIALDAAIQARLVYDVAAKLDWQLFSATGDGVTTPKGLFAYAGVSSVPVDGELALDHLLDAWGAALAGNVNMAGLKWVMTPREFVRLRKIKQGTDLNSYVLQADPTQDGVFRIWGAPVIVTSRIPDDSDGTGRAALVDFSQIAVARDMAPSIKILTERYADYDEQAIRVVARYDAAPLNAGAIVRLTGIEI